MRKSRFDVPVLSAATALGVVAWFLPPAYAIAVAVTAILTVAAWLARPARAEPRRRPEPAPLSRSTPPGSGQRPGGVFHQDSDLGPWPSPPAFGGVEQDDDTEPAPDAVADLRNAVLLQFADTQRLIRDGHAQLVADLQAHNAELRGTLARIQAESADLRAQVRDADRQSRRSSLISFWGGVAISIPIGVLINLATG